MEKEKKVKKEIYVFLGLILAIYTGLLDKLSAFGNKFSILIVILLFIFSYNFKLKKFRKEMLALAIFFSLIVIESFKNFITLKIGSYIYSPNAILGFLLIFALIYLIYTDYIKYHKLLERTYFMILIVLGITFREKIKILTYGGNLILRILPNNKYPQLTFLILILIIQILIYYIFFGKKSEESFIKKWIRKLKRKRE